MDSLHDLHRKLFPIFILNQLTTTQIWIAIELVFVYFYFVETKGPTLEELARLFDGDDAVAHIDIHAIEKDTLRADHISEINEGTEKRVPNATSSALQMQGQLILANMACCHSIAASLEDVRRFAIDFYIPHSLQVQGT